jgi:hypothetical protein
MRPSQQPCYHHHCRALARVVFLVRYALAEHGGVACDDVEENDVIRV